MKVSYSWLKEFVDIELSPQILAEKLTMAGLEVEAITTLEPQFTNVIVGEIISIKGHPNADRLVLCEVRTDKGLYSVVCGAKNMKVMDKVALALPGAKLANGMLIEKVVIRGVESEGMMCSPKELGLGEDERGLLILPPDAELGREVSDLYGIKDVILDIAVTPNRPDCLSIIGIAREVSAITGAPFRDVTVESREEEGEIKEWIDVEIKDETLCPRYTIKIIDSVTVASSPFWLKHRLESLGIRSINNIVDITNLIMLERGQPLHAFDYCSIEGKTLIVKRAERGEEFVTLDGIKRSLTEEMLVIADKKKPLAVAGVMGGLDSEVRTNTKTILLESAYFLPQSVRRTSKTLNLSTESSYRFERGVDPGENIVIAIERAASLIKTYAGGRFVTKTLDISRVPFSTVSIKWRPERVNSILGTDIKRAEMVGILKRLGIESIDDGQEFLTAKPPSFRVDLKEETDLIEEIARLKGYCEIPETLPEANLSLTRLRKDQAIERKLRGFLRDCGFLEVMNYSFVSPALLERMGFKEEGLIYLLNPLTKDQSVMRPSLIPGLLENMGLNLKFKNTDIRIFELNKVFYKGRDADRPVIESRRLTGLCSGRRWKGFWEMTKERVDLFDIKGVVEGILTSIDIDIEEMDFHPLKDLSYMNPARSYNIILKEKVFGILGEIHPDILDALDINQPAFIFDFDFDGLIALKPPRKLFTPLPKYPSIVRDISFIVDESLLFKEIKKAIEVVDKVNIKDIRVFDVYRGKEIPQGKKSIALSITYLSTERTLTEDEVNVIHHKIREKLNQEFGAIIR